MSAGMHKSDSILEMVRSIVLSSPVAGAGGVTSNELRQRQMRDF